MKSLDFINQIINMLDTPKDATLFIDKNNIDILLKIQKDLEVLDLIYTKHIDISDLKMAMALEKDRNYKEEDGLRFYNIAPFNVKRITIDEYKKLKKWLEEQE